MRLAPFANEADVDEALRLFHVSTLSSAGSGNLAGKFRAINDDGNDCRVCLGIEGFTTREDQEEIARIEKQIRRRFVVGSQVSEHAIVQDFIRQVTSSPIEIHPSPLSRTSRIIPNVVFTKFFMQWSVVVMFNIVCNVKFLFESDKSTSPKLLSFMAMYRYRAYFFSSCQIYFHWL